MQYIYSAMVLYSAGKEITEDAITAILNAAGAEVDAAKVKALVASLEGVDIKEAIANASFAAPAAAAAAAPAAAADAPAAAPAETQPQYQPTSYEQQIQQPGNVSHPKSVVDFAQGYASAESFGTAAASPIYSGQIPPTSNVIMSNGLSHDTDSLNRGNPMLSGGGQQ